MTRVEPLDESLLEPALRLVLADPGSGRPADALQILQYRRQLARPGVTWLGFVARQRARIVGATLAVVFPGRTAVVMLPEPGELGIERSAQRGTLLAAVQALDAREPHYSQALLEPQARTRPQLLQEAGFQRLGRLAYLLHAVGPRPAESRTAHVEWRSYNHELRPLLAETIQATYRDSLDMPELAGVRPMDDVLASHQAAGEFDPALWELAILDGRPAGCLLLAPQFGGRLLELVYLGVVPAFRGRGVGARLVARALEHARRRRVTHVLVAVDVRNSPARRLYERFGFHPLLEREVFVRFARP